MADFTIDVIHHFPKSHDDKPPSWVKGLNAKLDTVLTSLGTIELKEGILFMKVSDIQAQADETLQKVTADADVGNAVKTVVLHQNELMAALQKQLEDAVAMGATPESLQKLSETITAIRNAETSNAQVVADAVTAGTPATPPVDTPPVETPPTDTPPVETPPDTPPAENPA